MVIYREFLIVATLMALAGSALAQGAGDPQKGKQVFNQCSACHSLKEGKNGIGPSLHGILGEKAGTVPGYNFSAATKNSKVIWSEDTLRKYLADPQKVIPGNKMPFPGIKNPTQLNNLIAYLKQATK